MSKKNTSIEDRIAAAAQAAAAMAVQKGRFAFTYGWDEVVMECSLGVPHTAFRPVNVAVPSNGVGPMWVRRWEKNEVTA